MRASLFLSFTVCLILAVGYSFYGRWGLLAAFAIAILWGFYIYFYIDQLLYKAFSDHQIEGSDPWKVYQTVNHLAEQAGISTPQIFMSSLDAPTVFSIGIFYRSIIISKSLIEVLTQEELKSVLAHEIFHIKKDTLSFGVGSAVINFCLFWGHTVDKTILFILKKIGWKFHQRGFLIYLFMPVALFCFKLIVHSKSDYRADQFAASISGNPEYLAQALWKLESYCQTKPIEVPLAMAHLFIVSPLKKDFLTHYFVPSIESRIRKLINRYPL